VLAHPALDEGFGLTPLEAMAAGTPVVVSDAGSLPEVVGEAGLRVRPDDPSAWAEALARLLADDSLAARLAEAGRERAAQFSPRRMAEATLSVYRAARLAAAHAGAEAARSG
jgi:glycosyltransferase involved in cell wall biosynthesis